MNETEYQHTLIGDWLKTSCGVGTIQQWGKWTGKRWVKSTRKKGTGFFVHFRNGDNGYIHRGHCEVMASPLY